MASVSTGKILRKLERIVDFRVGEGASEKHPIVLHEGWIFGGSAGPATDGTKIFMPRKEKHLKSERDNELLLADSTAHEADHIREFNEYFGEEAEKLREQEVSLFGEFCERNYSELEENPALASWIVNVVEDRRIDAQRREQLPGAKRFHNEVVRPCARYFRPSMKGLSELDTFRELYLQKTSFGDTLEPVPAKYKKLLEQVVKITYSADSIHKDKDAVTRIYQLFKENFDITPPTSRLPSLFNRKGHGSGSGKKGKSKGKQGKQKGKPKDNKGKGSQQGGKPKDSQGQQPKDGSKEQGKSDPQQQKPKDGSQGGQQQEIKPRQGRKDKDKKPKGLGDGKKFDENKNSRMIAPAAKEEDRRDLYEKAGKEAGTRAHIQDPEFNELTIKAERDFKNKYAGEIQSMKRIFRKLRLRDYGDKSDLEGYELDYEEFLQSELEEKVTGIKGKGKIFKTEVQNRLRPAWAVLTDISGSTSDIIEQIKASLLIQGEALGITDWPFGLYAFSNHIYVIKDFVEKHSPEVANKIVSLDSMGGTNLGPSLRVVGSLLKRQKETPKGITIITDGAAGGDHNSARKALKWAYDQKMYPFLINIGRESEKDARYMVAEIGEEHYSIIDRDKLYELPGEMFRLFKTYGIAR